MRPKSRCAREHGQNTDNLHNLGAARLFGAPAIRLLLRGVNWYARLDLNQRPLVPETNALSRLSYGRTGVLI